MKFQTNHQTSFLFGHFKISHCIIIGKPITIALYNKFKKNTVTEFAKVYFTSITKPRILIIF